MSLAQPLAVVPRALLLPWFRCYREFSLLCALIATRVACRSHYLYDIDSVNFALGMRRFDPAVHQPHPPGYFLYVALGRLMERFLVHDANAALVTISILASCGALAFIYRLTEAWYGRNAALFAGVLVVFSPLVWFHGTVALTYAPEFFFASMSGYLCWRAWTGQGPALTASAVSIALAAGFRPSFLLLFLPLLVFSGWRASRKVQLLAASAFGLTLLAWAVPLLWASGGPAAYWNALFSLWRTVPAKQTAFNSSIMNSIARLLTIAFIYILCFGAASALPLLGSPTGKRRDRNTAAFCWVWVTPGLLFFTFIFLKFVTAGYLLLLSPPIFAYLGRSASDWWSWGRSSRLKTVVLSLALACNGLLYFRAPVYCSYGAVRRFERDLEEVLRTIPTVASPRNFVIVGFDSHFLGYRHAGYYLPAFLTLQYPEVRLASGVRIFSMQHDDTLLLNQLPSGPYQRFLLAPLPGDDPQYHEYLLKVKERFAPGQLRTVVIHGKEYTSGPVAALPSLFPQIAGEQR